MPTFFDADSDNKAKPPAYCTRSASQSDEMDTKTIKPDTDKPTAATSFASLWSLPSTSTSTTTTSTPTVATSQNTYQVPDRYAPQVFNGIYPDPEAWLAHFKRYVACRQLTEHDQLAFFPLFLQEKAIDWYDALQPTQRETVDDLLTEFKQFFCPSPLDHVLDTETVFTRLQRPTEKVRDYVSAMQKLSKRIPGIDDELLKGMIVRGFLPQIKAFILRQQPATVKSIGDILEIARVAETAGILDATATQGDMSAVMEEIKASRKEVQQLAHRMDTMTVGTMSRRSPTPEVRRVTFDTDVEQSPLRRRPPFQQRARRGPTNLYTQRSWGPTNGMCDRCGRQHFGTCPATNVNCFTCGRRGHLSVRCRSGRRGIQTRP